MDTTTALGTQVNSEPSHHDKGERAREVRRAASRVDALATVDRGHQGEHVCQVASGSESDKVLKREEEDSQSIEE